MAAISRHGRTIGVPAAHLPVTPAHLPTLTISPMPWITRDFEYPQRLELTTGHHLRPIRPEDAEIDQPAVMGSRDSLFAIYGEAGMAA